MSDTLVIDPNQMPDTPPPAPTASIDATKAIDVLKHLLAAGEKLAAITETGADDAVIARLQWLVDQSWFKLVLEAALGLFGDTPPTTAQIASALAEHLPAGVVGAMTAKPKSGQPKPKAEK